MCSFESQAATVSSVLRAVVLDSAGRYGGLSCYSGRGSSSLTEL